MLLRSFIKSEDDIACEEEDENEDEDLNTVCEAKRSPLGFTCSNGSSW